MATKNPNMFVRVTASLIPQHFKFEHENKLAGLNL